MKLMTIIAFLLLIIGGLNWGIVGFFGVDIFSLLFGPDDMLFARIIYILVGLSAGFCVPLFKYVCETDVSRRAAIPPRNAP